MAEQLAWFRADTNLPSHDKIIDLCGEGPKGKAAAFVYLASLAWAVGHGTDGLVKRAILPFIHGSPVEARLLVRHCLWDEVEAGWVIRNFGTRQMVGAVQQVIADELAEKRSEAGRKAATARWTSDATSMR